MYSASLTVTICLYVVFVHYTVTHRPVLNVLYEILCLMVAMYQYTNIIERRPYSISSYVINPGSIKWIKAVNTVG